MYGSFILCVKVLSYVGKFYLMWEIFILCVKVLSYVWSGKEWNYVSSRWRGIVLMYGRLPKPKGEMPDTSHKSKQCCITLLLPRGFSRIQYYSQQSSFSQCKIYCDQVKLMYGRLPMPKGEMPDTSHKRIVKAMVLGRQGPTNYWLNIIVSSSKTSRLCFLKIFFI